MRGALALIALIAATPALAQDVRVRSGEHETHSRLVLYLPDAAEFAVEESEGAVEIDFGGALRFDTSEVFRLIPRNRIAEVGTAAPGRFRIDLACVECPVEVSRLSDTTVMIDVSDPTEPSEETAETPEEPEPALQSPPAPEGAAQAAEPSPTANPGDTPSVAIRLPSVSRAGSAVLLPGGIDLSAGEAAANAASPLHNETARAIADQIARAASQGLLDVEPAVDMDRLSPIDGEKAPASAPEPVAAPADPPAETDLDAFSTSRHLSVRNSIDDAFGAFATSSLPIQPSDGACLDDDLFDVSVWTPDDTRDLSHLRSSLVGEFDHPDPAAIEALARAYVGLSFGAEAAQIIDVLGRELEHRDVLLAMADIVDHGQTGRPGPLASQYDCQGASALWAVLSSRTIPDSAEMDPSSIILAFSALPPHLRQHLGPKLAQRVLGKGDVETASALSNAIHRIPGAPDPAATLLGVQIDLEIGREAHADATLMNLVEATEGQNTDAVRLLIERSLEEGYPVTDDVLEAVESQAYAMKGTEPALRLTALRIEALAARGDVRPALDVLAGVDGAPLSPETQARLKGIAYASAAEKLEDAEFLVVAVRAAESLGRSPEEMEARRALAERLGALGLLDLASDFGVPDSVPQPVVTAPPEVPAELTEGLRTELPDIEPMLERTEALIQHSAALRQRLTGALDR